MASRAAHLGQAFEQNCGVALADPQWYDPARKAQDDAESVPTCAPSFGFAVRAAATGRYATQTSPDASLR
jgi:hypothetical protein